MAETTQTSQEQSTEQQPRAEESTPEVVQEEPTVISEDDVVTSPPALIFINPSIPTPSSSSVKFTLDDVPHQKWKIKFQEMQAWCFVELQRPHMTHSTVIESFLARLTGFKKDWFDSLGQYRQLQYLNAPTIDEFMNALYCEFCGKQDHLKDIAREEFFKLKCCSYNPKDINKHFENAVRRFYLIGGMDDPNIKQVNEDVNSTKASHTGMSPEHLQLATTELAQLQAEGLIEPTNSQWACQAFYVNKRAEQVREKMRLVIDYKLLNHFLADDKFPLLNRKALFANLSTAKIFSKFDLKAAPSLFQKAITRIYHPIMKSALVYIDDILLFSPDESSHSQLLSNFHELTKRHGVMLAQKKMVIGVPEINFLGMQIKDGQYSLQPHVGQELLKFLDANLSKKKVQQFLGIVNYMVDFIDHLSTTIKALQNILKKNAPAWSEEQTKAIQEIKQKVYGLPALSIPTDGKKDIANRCQ
ncbi:Reverse transcriptase domain-containing protein [Abeliophyllum distichum]|uniref:Reverse transcriptase domain-containing protein n=1 Tax=Abeliophyllum distichum TaxID=126358 RepID=A0ABD1RDB4_9LAMI